MKRLLYLLLLFTVAFQANAQENVFILVDVSGSIKNNNIINEGKNIINDICVGTFDKNKYSQWQISDILDNKLKNIINGTSTVGLITQNSRVSIIPFGDLHRFQNYALNIKIINNFPSDFQNYFSSNYPNEFKDSWTYYDIAPAYIANELKISKINEYYLITIWDGAGEAQKTGTGYSSTQDDLINRYKNLPKGDKKGIGTIKFEKGGSRYKIEFEKVKLDSLITPPPPDTTIPLKIELTTFKGGTSSKPIVHKENKITIGWFCKNAPKNAQYKIRVSPIGISGEKMKTFTATGNSYNVSNLSNGKWKITVSSDSANFNASSATTTIEINTGGSYWFLWLLLIAALGGGGYWYWKKTQVDKMTELNSMSNNDSFSSGSTLNTNSDSSGYF